jgi:hypothetical protein
VVVVMTPEAQRSEWVTREVDVALRDGRPIASLLLRGDPFFLLAGLPHEDVSTGGPPGSDWVEGLRAMTTPRAGGVAVPLERGRTAEALGIEVKGGVFVPLLERGAVVPCQRTEIFTTADDGQSQIKVTVYRGNSGMVAQNQRVGVFEVRVPNPGARGTPNISVTFEIDARGAFRLLAVDQGTGLPASVTSVG